ncbi:PREDICTED: protein Flattop homolog isoform X2 [Priapulus caudatus]|uniref:Cilia- and flagella-associated protein 126 n=1 Tax=Priapulus caudatus TaxID=37621 RepID=A0ABM1EGT1_PRICU|nr:PREDICTED: protein Flattop homolog isoform X2 [Priapulus caudatus]
MAYHFSANQYEKEFNSKRLQNWELPKNQKERPRTLQGFTRVIVNDRGHLLSHISQSPRSPWGEFVGTWDMPEKVPGTSTTSTARSEAAQKRLLEIKHQAEKLQKPQSFKHPTPGN